MASVMVLAVHWNSVSDTIGSLTGRVLLCLVQVGTSVDLIDQEIAQRVFQ